MDFGVQQISSSGLSLDWISQVVLPLVIILVVVFLIYIFLLILRKFLSSKVMLEKKIFRITVPQRLSDNDEEKKEIKELLGEIENFYANLGGLKAEKGIKSWLYGREDIWSFEIVVSRDRLITFYIALPPRLEAHIQQQFLSVYPSSQIEEVDDYNIFAPHGSAVGGFLKLVKNKMLPIQTYKQIEGDPMVGVLSALSKLPEGHTVAIQYIVRSARAGWRTRGVKVASMMQQGKNLKEALSSTAPGMVGVAKGLFTTTKKKEEEVPGQQPQYKLSPLEEHMVESIEEKASRAGMDVNIRMISFAPAEEQAKEILRQVSNAYGQYSNYEYANGFKVVIKGKADKLINDFIHRNFDEKIKCVLNTEEMASLWHLPLPHTDVPNVRWLMARQLPPPVNMPQDGLVLGENFYRGEQSLVKLKDGDRQRHMYIIGMTGTGKSYFQANLAVQDIANGKGVCVVDPHGSLIDDYIMPHIPESRRQDVIYFDPADTERPVGLNMLEAETPQEMDFAASEMITIFYKLLPDPAMAGPMFEHYMRNALLALMADKNNPGTLVELARIFTDDKFRAEKMKHVKDIMVKNFWEKEYPASQRGSSAADMLSYVISKTGRFVENEMMRNIIGQSKSGINFRQVMDEGKILLINLSKGKLGEMNSNLLGLIAVSKLQMAAMARADMPEEQRKDFYLYIDEFQNFITDSISVILAEARKYKLNLIMAHQYIAQLVDKNDTKIRDAVFGNVGNIVSFRIGVDDSEVMAKQLAPEVGEYDLLNIEKFNAYVRILIDNTASGTFNMHAFPLPDNPRPEMVGTLKNDSRNKYGRSKQEVYNNILERSKMGEIGVEK